MSGKRRRTVRERASGGRIRFYLESSALLSSLFERDPEIIRSVDPAVTAMSVLTVAEARRSVQRAVVSGRIDQSDAVDAFATIDHLERRCMMIDINGLILDRASRRFPAEPIRTLDAIHLATAEMLDDPAHPVTLLTRDRRIAENAELLGLRVV